MDMQSMSRSLAPRQCSIRVLSCDHKELMDGSEKRKGICLPFKRHSAVTDPDREMRCGGGERGGKRWEGVSSHPDP